MEQFEQLLTCAICLDRYRNPKLLPCQHSFCMEPCMDGLVDYVRRQVKCPECRAEHRIPYQGVQAFPTNVTLQRFLELHIEITGELPDPTSGQTMERCGVCSEKSYCSLCVHCDKKCCPECKDAHMDILRREITRINSQIRRGLHRLQDALALVEKNTLGLQTNCASVVEEVDEIYRRLSKALKDRTEYLRTEIERYSGTELRGLIQLKENLELEIANIQSNCDLADAHINENVPWEDAELLDTKELFLRTVEFIRNFEYEAGDYGRRVRFVMAHDPNQLVLHVAGYGELNIKPETGSTGHLGTTGGLAPPGGSPGLMRSKSDHRLASQYRQQEEERLARNRYVPDYEYETPEYEAPRNKSRYRSRFMRHRDGEESDGDSRSTVRFTSSTTEPNPREKVLDTEDAARGPLSGIFRLTDSPRVMKKLQEHERAGKRKKEEPPAPQPPTPKPQVQVRKAPVTVSKQTSEDDEISRIKKANKSNTPTQSEAVEDRQPIVPSPISTPTPREPEREPEEPPRRTSIVSRRTSSETHTPGVRSASSDSSTGSESSGSGIRSTGASFTAEEMKQKYLSRAPAPTAVAPASVPASTTTRDPPVTPTSSPRPTFQSRFLGAGNRAAPPPPLTPAREEPKKKDEEEDDDDDDDESTSSSEETETETEEESETETRTTATASTPVQERQRGEAAMARTDIGPLLARSAEARRGSKEDSPSTRYSPRGSPAHSASSPTSLSSSSSPGGYTSRFVSHADAPNTNLNQLSQSNSINTLENVRFRNVINDDEVLTSEQLNEDNCSGSDDSVQSHSSRDSPFERNNKNTMIPINNETDEQTQIGKLNDSELTKITKTDSINKDSGESVDESEDVRIDNFFARIVRDYNCSREGFEETTRSGSDGEHRETSSDESVSDEIEALTNVQINGINNETIDLDVRNERLLTSIVEEEESEKNEGKGFDMNRGNFGKVVGKIEDNYEEDSEEETMEVSGTSFEIQSEINGTSHDLDLTTTLDFFDSEVLQRNITEELNETGNEDISKNIALIREDSEESDAEDLGEILSSVVHNAKKMELEFLKSEKPKEKSGKIEITRTSDWEDDEEDSSVKVSIGLEDIFNNSNNVNHLFDDQGWVITDEDPEFPKSRGISPSFSQSPIQDTEKSEKTDSPSASSSNDLVDDRLLLTQNEERSIGRNEETTNSDTWSLMNDTASSRGSYVEDSENSQSDEINEEATLNQTADNNGLSTKNINGETKTDDNPMNIPMKMVTTVFCVSVLCYGVLMNLFL